MAWPGLSLEKNREFQFKIEIVYSMVRHGAKYKQEIDIPRRCRFCLHSLGQSKEIAIFVCLSFRFDSWV